MAERVLVDLGSSTVKAYRAVGEEAELLKAESIDFKDGFTPEHGFSDDARRKLEAFVASANPETIYGTALIRTMSPEAVEQLRAKLSAELEVVSQDDEAQYLEVALAGRYDGTNPVLLINAGGGSTELVTLQNHEHIEEAQLDLGVGTVIGETEGINDETSAVSLDELVGKLRDGISAPKTPTPIAFFSGGELTYMQVADYPLKPNDVFEDVDHPSKITLDALKQRNEEIFSKVTLKELEQKMPDNPSWMHGARAYCALTQAICEKYGVETVIPSDANLIDGIVRSS